ncbi:hypothetical protein D3C87_1122540 [compost metagenome]
MKLSAKIIITIVILSATFFYAVTRYHSRSVQSAFPELFTEDIEYRFHSYAEKVTGKQSLYVAKLKQTEVIERTSYPKILWVDLPPMIVKVDVPVEYNYFINLISGWSFKALGEGLIVKVPELSSSTPALDIAKLKMTIEAGSLLRNQKNALDKMTQELPGLLVDRAIENRELVREEARKSVENFVRTWIQQVTNRQFDRAIKVEFPSDSKSL